jgi:YVTN family beta-propeller protein
MQMKYRGLKIHPMTKQILFFLATAIAVCGTASASTLFVSATGQFSGSDVGDSPLVTPNGVFSLSFAVDSNPAPLVGSVSSLGFDVPVEDFSYSLNNATINVTPSEITFYTLADGGLFTVAIGSGLSGLAFLFEGSQVFTGTTASPVFAPGAFAITQWTFSDPGNFDSQTPLAAFASVTPTPEPSSVFFLTGGLVVLIRELRKRRQSMRGDKNRRILELASLLFAVGACVHAQVPITQVMNIPNTGQQITPLAPRGSRFTYLNPGLVNYPDHVVGQAVTTVASPDGKTLLVLTTGDYGIYTTAGAQDSVASTDWVFVYDITNPVPVQKQAIQVLNTYNGIVWDPSGATFYVAGGRNDNVHIYTATAGTWAEAAGSPIALGHTSQAGGTPPEAAGIAVSSDGTKMVVTNYENDSVTVLTKAGSAWSKTSDFDLRPGIINSAQSGVPGGAYPFWVTIANNNTAYVSCMRDREIDVVNIMTAATPSLTTRVKLTGQPLKSTLSAAQNTLYVAEEQSDSLAVINTATNTLVNEVSVAAPAGVIPAAYASLSGNNTNSVTLSPDQATLYVTNGNTNNIAVVGVAQLAGGNPVLGLIPTGQYPNSVATSSNGQFLYVVNGKSPSGPNPTHCKGNSSGPIGPPDLTTAQCNASNAYTLQLTKAGLQFIPTPPTGQLGALTTQVAINNNYSAGETPETAATMDFVASKIQHVVYIIKENRTYDQILGDLPAGNGDPGLTEFGASITPNQHSLAQSFVTLDNFYDISEVSYDGWAWSTGALAPDIVIRQTPVNYSFRGGVAYESEGDIRGINLVSRTGTNATNPNVLPGLVDTAAPDGPGNEINLGYIWNSAFNAGLTVRNYGFFDDNIGSAVPFPNNTNAVQVHPANPQLSGLPESGNTPQSQLSTDLSFRGYDLNNADTYLEQEFERDVTANGLKNLSLVRMPHDHTGNYSTALSGVNTPELQVADNDYAVGKLVQFIANSPNAGNTLVFVIEDDAQNGGDHVDAHRSTAFIAGPYVKQGGAVVSAQYNTINFLRTMERVLGLAPMHLTDAVAQPMADVFDPTKSTWTFTAVPSAFLYSTSLPLPPQPVGLVIPKSTHDAKYWAKVTKGLDFSKEDRVDPVAYNRILWKGLKGDTVYPGDANLAETRKRYKQALKAKNASDDDDDGK